MFQQQELIIQQIILFIVMIFGAVTHNNLNEQGINLYKLMIKQLIGAIKNELNHYNLIEVKNHKYIQDVKEFNSAILMLKNQSSNKSKSIITDKIVCDLLGMALNKLSYIDCQKTFKLKYSKYFQSQINENQILNLIRLIKEKIINIDSILNKLKSDSHEKIPKEIQSLVTKVQCYQKIISDISQFPIYSNNKAPQLYYNKKDQIFSAKIQKQIENMYIANNIINNVSTNLAYYQEKSCLEKPKQVKDIYLVNIVNPLTKALSLIKNQTLISTETIKQANFQIDKPIQSLNIQKSSSNLQQKWMWMKNLLNLINCRQNLANLQCKQVFFQPKQRQQMNTLLKDLQLNNKYFKRLVHMTRKADLILFKNKDNNDIKLKKYSPQTIFDKFEPLFDVSLSVCQQISRLPIVIQQKNIYKSNNGGDTSIIEQFTIVKNSIKGQTQKQYYQLALKLAKKLNLFENKDELTYENMAKERKRFILKVEQMTKQLQKYSASVNKHTSLYQNNNRLEQCSITPRTTQSSSIINKISYLFGGKSSQIYLPSNEDLQIRLIETISKNQSLQLEAKDLRYQNFKINHQSQSIEAQLRNIKQKCIKQIEQLTPPNKQGRKPIIQFETTLQMFNKLIYLKNQKTKSAQNDINKSFLRQSQLISLKQEMQKQNSNNLWQIGNKDKQIQRMNAEIIKINVQNLGLKQNIQKMKRQFPQKLKKLQEDLIIRTNQLINKQNQLINKQKQNDNLMKQLQTLKADQDPQQNINQLHSNIDTTAHIQLSIYQDKQQQVVSNQANGFQVIGHSAQIKINQQKIRQLQKTISNERKWRLSAEERAKQQINKFESAQRQSKSLRQIITKLQLKIASLQSDLTNQKALFNKQKQKQKKQIQLCNKNIIDCTDCYQKQIDEIKQNHSKQILYHINANELLQKQIEALVAQEAKDKQCQLSKLGYIQQLKLQMQNKQTQFKAQIQRQREQQRNYIKTLQQQQRNAKQNQLRILQTSKNAQIQQKLKQIEDEKAQKAFLQGRIAYLQGKIAKLQKQNESIQLQLQKSLAEQKESHKASLIQQKGIFQGKLRQLQKQLLLNKTQHEKQMQQQQKKIAQILDEKDRVDNAIKFLQNEFDKLDIQLKESKQQNKELKIEIEVNNINKQKITDKNKQLQHLNSSNCQKIKKQKKQFQHELKQLKNQHQIQLIEIGKDIDFKDNTMAKLQSQLTQVKHQKDKLIDQNKELSRIIEQNSKNQTQITDKLRKQFLNQYASALKKQKQKIYQNLGKKGTKSSLDQSSAVQLYYFDQLFQGQTLENHVDYKIQLCQHIKKLVKDKSIAQTILRYKYDLKNKTSFHQYIDGKSNLLLVVKTKQQLFIAGFYTGVYENNTMTEPGMLVCLSNNESYILNSNQMINGKKNNNVYKAMDYNKIYIIFGNAEIRIREGEGKLFSNFGVNNAFYNNRGKKRSDFLGVQTTQTQLQSYQIYEIQFEDELNTQQTQQIRQQQQFSEKIIQKQKPIIQQQKNVKQIQRINQLSSEKPSKSQQQVINIHLQNLKSKDKELKQLINKNQQNLRIIITKQHKLQSLQAKIIQLQKIIKQNKQKISQLQLNKQNITSQKLTVDIQKQMMKIQYQSKIIELQKSIKLFKKQKQQKQQQIREKNQKIDDLNLELMSFNKQKFQKINQSQVNQKEEGKYKELLRQIDQIKINHAKQCEQLLFKQNSKHQNMINQLNLQHEKSIKIKQEEWKDQLQRNMKTLRDKYQIQKQYNLKKISQLQNTVQVALKEKNQIKKEQNNENIRVQIMNDICNIITKQRKDLFDVLPKNYKQNSAQDVNLLNLYYYDLLFQGQLLQNNINYKFKLCQHIKKLSKDKNILRTRLLYTYDSKNKTNFHEYFDGLSNLLLIVKNKQQFYIAGFYTGSYGNKKMAEPGLLICLNNNQSYVLNTNQNANNKGKGAEISYRAMQYDKFYMIFGNAEMRIKAGQKKVFSNFGVNSSYYNNRGKKRLDFFGTQKTQIELQSYQIYKIQFDAQDQMKEQKRQIEEQRRQENEQKYEQRRQ